LFFSVVKEKFIDKLFEIFFISNDNDEFVDVDDENLGNIPDSISFLDSNVFREVVFSSDNWLKTFSIVSLTKFSER